MEIKVSVSVDFELFSEYQFFARKLEDALNGFSFSGYIGKNSGFERNSQAMSSNVYKYHIRLPGVHEPWDQDINIWKRTSDSFLIVTEHCFYPEFVQILYILSPSAHARVDRLLPFFIRKAEEFHALDKGALVTISAGYKLRMKS
ncbi:TPA: type II toxin-antitoxin system YafO family toxin [Escherichia coli]|nr:type II toxin-antitoxin system YafO family toxin [Escherichia coli]